MYRHSPGSACYGGNVNLLQTLIYLNMGLMLLLEMTRITPLHMAALCEVAMLLIPELIMTLQSEADLCFTVHARVGGNVNLVRTLIT